MRKTPIDQALSASTTEVFSARQQRMYDFLEANCIGVLSSVAADMSPHGAAIYFSVDRQFNVSFMTRCDTRKYENLNQNSRAMLTVFEPLSQTTLQFSGTATEITNSVQAGEVIGDNFSPATVNANPHITPPIIKLAPGAYAAFRIRPSHIHMAVYSRPATEDSNEHFQPLTPTNDIIQAAAKGKEQSE